MTARGVLLSAVLVAAAVSGIDSKPAVNIAGTDLIATRVLVLRDGSGSMGGTGPTLAAQMSAAFAAGIDVVGELQTWGFGFTAAGDERNALRTLERGLPGLDVDAIYLFSDFDNQTSSLDDSDTDGYNRLQALLAADGIRLYLSTVRRDPESGLVEIAERSGGGLIRAAGR